MPRLRSAHGRVAVEFTSRLPKPLTTSVHAFFLRSETKQALLNIFIHNAAASLVLIRFAQPENKKTDGRQRLWARIFEDHHPGYRD
jgi:hypothetical protein